MKKLKEIFKKILKKVKYNKYIMVASIGIFFIIFSVLVIMFLGFIHKKNDYSIVFDTAGGVVLSENIVLKDGKVEEPTTPTKYGFVFVEWQYNGKKYDFSKKVESNIVLTAVWKSNGTTEIVNINFDSNGGSIVSPIELAKGGVAVKPLMPRKEGYTFDGWYQGDKLFDFFTLVNEDIYLIAHWKKGNQREENPSENQSKNPGVQTSGTINVNFSELIGKWYLEGYSSVLIDFGVFQNEERKYGVEFKNISFDKFILFPSESNGYSKGVPIGGYFKTEEELMNHFKGYGYTIIKSGDALVVSQNGKTMKFTRNKAVFDMSRYNNCIGTWYLNEMLSDVSIKIEKKYDKNMAADVYWITTDGFDLETMNRINKQNYYPGTSIGDISIINGTTIFDKYNISQSGENLYVGLGANKLTFNKKPKIIPIEQLIGKWYLIGTNDVYLDFFAVDSTTYNIWSYNFDFCTFEKYTSSGCGGSGNSSLENLEKQYKMSLNNGVFSITNNGKTLSFIRNKSTVKVSGVLLDKDKINLVPGDSQSLYVSISPATADNQSVKWESLNKNIATVDAYGNVRAVATGTTTIRVTTNDGGFTADCEVVVVPQNVTGVSLNKTNVSLYYNEKINLIATVLPTNATNKNVTWTSLNSSVVTVSSAGVVTGVGIGSTTVIVTTQDGKYEAVANVTVNYKPISVTGTVGWGFMTSSYYSGTYIGTTVTASGGTGIFTYNIKLYRNGSFIVQNSNISSNRLEVTPGLNGSYYAEITVKDSAGNEKSYTTPTTFISF